MDVRHRTVLVAAICVALVAGAPALTADAGVDAPAAPGGCPEFTLLSIEHHDDAHLPDLTCTAGSDGGVLVTADETWTVPLPPVGLQITQTAATPSGHTEFIVRHNTTGELEAAFLDTDHDHEADGPAVDHADDEAPGPYQGGAPNRCSDDRWSSMGHWIYGPLVWLYNGSGAPAGVAAASELAFTSGYDNVAAGRDGCNAEVAPLLTSQVFAGGTPTPTNISSNRTCTTYDGLNVAGWVHGGAGYLGLACIWAYVDAGRGPRVLDGDIVLNTNYAWSTGAFSGSEYDVASVVAHEVGHLFGLGHAGSSASPSQLTMSGSGVYPVSIYARLLGNGDLQGLRTLYGDIPLDR
jgi:hypothetical protein